MEIKISSIGDKGNLSLERIGFNVLKDCELKYFILFKTKNTANGFLNKSKNSYWFLPENLKANDKVVLYTRKGNNSIKINPNGTSTYFFYWGLESTLFNQENDRVILINVKSYK